MAMATATVTAALRLQSRLGQRAVWQKDLAGPLMMRPLPPLSPLWPASPPLGCCHRMLFQASEPRQRRPPPRNGSKMAGQATPLPRPIPTSRPPSRPSPSPSSSSSSSSSAKQDLNSLWTQRRLPLVGAALAAAVLGFYIAPLLVASLAGGRCGGEVGEAGGANDNHQHHGHHRGPSSLPVTPDAVPTGLPPPMACSAAAFDASLDMPERIMGLVRLRKQLAALAHGQVLEVAVGTGRNLGFYRWELPQQNARFITPAIAATVAAVGPDAFVTSFTGVDLSEDALNVARRRLRSAVPGSHAVIPKNGRLPAVSTGSAVPSTASTMPAAPAVPAAPVPTVDVMDGRLRLFRADALHALPPPPSSSPLPSPPLYDTVLQTFGLCSVADPVALLANMAAVVRPDSGRILLLEHGRGRWPLVNRLLDRYAGRHFARFGCWWNRDVQEILDAATAAVPGLEVVRVRQPGWLQFGTLWWIELRVSAPARNKAANR